MRKLPNRVMAHWCTAQALYNLWLSSRSGNTASRAGKKTVSLSHQQASSAWSLNRRPDSPWRKPSRIPRTSSKATALCRSATVRTKPAASWNTVQPG